MISVSVDEAYAFDMLSILYVKFAFNGSPADMTPSIEAQNYGEMARQIKSQVGEERFGTVLSSAEFQGLIDKNKEIFDLVDHVKKNCDQGDIAYRIDARNYSRYVLKKELQKKFFGSEVKETKHGY